MIFKSKNKAKELIKEIEQADRYPVCYIWDELLEEVLNTADIIEADIYTIKFCCGTEVWVENKWHSYGKPYMVNQIYNFHIVPTPKTTAKLYNMHKDYLKKTFRDNRLKNLEESISKFNMENN